MSGSLAVRGSSVVRMRFPPGLVGPKGSPGYPLNSRTIDCRDFGIKDVVPGQNWTTQWQNALDQLDHGYTLLGPSVPWKLDGMIIPQKRELTIVTPGVFHWSGTVLPAAKRTNPATGIVYPPALITQFGDSEGLRFFFTIMDGWDLTVRGIYQSCGAFSQYVGGLICFTDAGIDQDVHETNAAGTFFSVRRIEYVNDGIRLQSGSRYGIDPTKYHFIDPTHMAEDTTLDIGFIHAFKNQGIWRAPRMVRSVPHPTNAGQTIYYVGGTTCFNEIRASIDATVYYNMDGPTLGGYDPDPVNFGAATYPTRYNGPDPITDPPYRPPYYPGFTRPTGILRKDPTSAGAQDVADQFGGSFTIAVNDWFGSGQVIGSPRLVSWDSRSRYFLKFAGNSVGFLLNKSGPTGNSASPGLASCDLTVLNQDLMVWAGAIIIDLKTKTITAAGFATAGTMQATTVRANNIAGATGAQLLDVGANPGTGKLTLTGQAGSAPPVLTSSGDVIWRASAGGTVNMNWPASLTVGGFGTAAALPAAPNRYLTVKDENGTLLKIPAYNP